MSNNERENYWIAIVYLVAASILLSIGFYYGGKQVGRNAFYIDAQVDIDDITLQRNQAVEKTNLVVDDYNSLVGLMGDITKIEASCGK